MRRDEAYLLDMLIAARKVERFAADLTQEAFLRSELHQSAIIRELQVIGEAARLVSEEGKEAYPEIAWTKIAGMRNRLVHEYFRISLEVVWQTVRDDIALLTAQLEPIVPPEDEWDK